MLPRGPRFRDLWPFALGAKDEIARRVSAGDLSDADGGALTSFSDKGYLVLPGAIEEPLIDALVRDVRSIGDHPGCFVTTDHRRGRPQTFSTSDFDSFESVFDPYVNFESARRVCFHPSVTKWLELCFDTRAVATQQLLFQRSNQHPIHQDTSVVCMEEPLLMLATWIALEDVVPGRGELTYYEGSHRIPHYPFVDGSKRLTPGKDDAERVREYVLTECARLGCEKRDFIAKKGDVFIWAADLAHGSNPRTLPEEETRLSVVTHYCPTHTKPFWLRFHPDKQRFVSHEGRAEYGSLYYELPVLGVARPKYAL